METTAKIYKYLGLFMVLALPFIFYFRHSAAPASVEHVVIGECIVWGLLIILLLIAKFGEKEPILFNQSRMNTLKTIGMSLLITVSLVLAGVVYRLFCRFVLHMQAPVEELTKTILNYPFWLRLMLVIRAGVVEETFFRAYAMTRIKQITNSNFLAFTIPLVLFAGGHYSYGTINHVVGALVLGIVLAVWYIKRKNLASNIIGHTLFDSLALFGKM